ncbi:dihydroxyacetone kinase-like protein [Arcanobacterium pluranimalium]|uniref:dihydroxyacetone kinase subunit DhaL n=1 Tax=Arcanobacterium pluranimalium TaxID=108028 RepID=UPI0019574240|nr:dihydroxyacetone kinase-like protein [Arcanobacterium pluranimalium]
MITTDFVTAWITRFGELIQENQAMLTELDSPIGDADHGGNMARGMSAAVPALADAANLEAQLKGLGMTMLSKVGGTSGPLYGTFFLKAAKELGSQTEVSDDVFIGALRAGLDGLVSRGKAELGDKTMVDALTPAIEALEAAGDLALGAPKALEAATAGRDATIPMLAKKGRASYLGDRSIGHQDPGATSATMLFEALAGVVA